MKTEPGIKQINLVIEFQDFLEKEVFTKLVKSKSDFKRSQELREEFAERFVRPYEVVEEDDGARMYQKED